LIRRLEVDLPLEGLTAARRVDFISDIHIRNRRALEEFIEATRGPRSDVLFLGGDYAEKLRYLLPLFDHLAAVYPRVFAVYGNNDHVARRRLEAIARRTGVRFLEDEVVDLDGIRLVGTRDPARDKPRLPPLPADGPVLVLAHSPDILLQMDEARPATVLAGHVHGGQIRIPFWPWWWSHTRVGRRYGEGLSRRGRITIFTGRGIGCSLVDLRNVPREIYTVTLSPPGAV
jgi:predicted MPP superfamily phosphohydrolase